MASILGIVMMVLCRYLVFGYLDKLGPSGLGPAGGFDLRTYADGNESGTRAYGVQI